MKPHSRNMGSSYAVSENGNTGTSQFEQFEHSKNNLCRVKLYKSKLVCLNALFYLVISHSKTLRNVYAIFSTSNMNNRVM
jgi:hypothetical protein